MLKFFAWFIAILLFLITFSFVFIENIGSIFFSPKGIKQALDETNFYSQSKSIIKNNVLSLDDLNDQEIVEVSDILNRTIDEYDFQSETKKTIDDFFENLKTNTNTVLITYDLRAFKTIFLKNIKESDLPKDDIIKSIPDEWRVDLKKQLPGINVLSFYFRNHIYIFVAYFILWLLLFLFCILISKKYLNLFFITLLLCSLPLFGLYILFYLLRPSEVINFITAGLTGEVTREALSQGGSGLKTLVESLTIYVKNQLLSLLFWQSLIPMVVSIIGLVIIKFVKTDSRKIPLND